MLVCVQRGHKIFRGGIPLLSTFCSKKGISIWNTELACAVGGKIWNSQNCSAGCLAPISLELAPKKVKSNNRGFGVYQLAQTGEARYLRGFQLVRASLVRFWTRTQLINITGIISSITLSWKVPSVEFREIGDGIGIQSAICTWRSGRRATPSLAFLTSFSLPVVTHLLQVHR